MPSIKSRDQRRSLDRLMTALTLKTPWLVPTKCSPERITKPSHIPDSKRSSKPPTRLAVLGTLNTTHSPNGISLALLRRPFIN